MIELFLQEVILKMIIFHFWANFDSMLNSLGACMLLFENKYTASASAAYPSYLELLVIEESQNCVASDFLFLLDFSPNERSNFSKITSFIT